MQNCFRQYPEIYGSELDTDEELDENAMADRPQTDASESSSPNDSGRPAENKSTREQRAQSATEQVEQDHGDAEKHYIGSAVEPKSEKSQSRSDNASVKEHAKSAAGHVKKGIYDAVSEEEEVVPKAAFDATAANGEKKTEKR
jgi:intermembrane space import and assembly protein 40